MPESTGHGSTHTDRLHHHRARVRQSRLALDQAAADAAREGYAPNGQSNSTTGPTSPGNGDHDEHN